MELSQVAIYNDVGTNLALGKAVFASGMYLATDGPSAPPNTIVSGKLVAPSGSTSVYKNSGSAANDYITIDLGMNYYIASVVIYGRADSSNPGRNSSIRVQLLNTSGANDIALKELVTTTTAPVNTIDLTTKITVPKFPEKPFAVPRPLPLETSLGGTNCPTRCHDKQQIDSLVQQYNANPANVNSQIIKVLRAATPSTTRCDYEVEIVRKIGTKKTVGRELISMASTLAKTTPNVGVAYGRFVRLRPAATGGDGFLSLSQLVVSDEKGTNLALNRPVFGTSRFIDPATGTMSSEAKIVTNGTLSAGAWPNIWVSGTSDRKNEFFEVDLGISQPISSITYYGGTNVLERNKGVRIQVLATNETFAVPISETVLDSTNTQQTIRFNKCDFTYTPTALVGNFIQENTLLLAATDTSGGVLTFKNIGASVMNTMVQIAKVGPAGPNTCDVLFTDLYSEYDDYLYNPGFTETTTLTKRFTLTNTGNCVMAVVPGGIVDVSMNAVGIMSRNSALVTPYTITQCQVNCRDPAILSSLKQKLNTQSQTTTVLPNFNTVTQSFANGNTTCEYMMIKDITTKNNITGSFSTETGIDTYVTATFNMDEKTCAASLNKVIEIDPDLLTLTTDSATGDTSGYINGIKIQLPEPSLGTP